MTQKHRSEPHDWREGRRLRAWELHQQGWKQKDIAAALGVTPGAVSQWLKRGRAGGVAQRELLAQCAEAFGFIGQVWTSKRVAAVIKRFLGVTYHRAHVSRLLRTLGFSVQKPIVRAAQRDDAVIAAWWDARWPALKKTLPHSSRPSSG
jgi:transposase